MANITAFLENELLKFSLGKSTTWAKPTYTYAALFTVSPTTAYTSTVRDGTEVSGVGYSRLQIAWDTPAAGEISNSAALTWNAGGTWSSGNSITTVGIFDAPLVGGSPSGNLLWFGQLSAPVTMNNGDSFSIPIGLLTIKIS